MMELDDDLRNLELDRPGRGKSVEQIKKHTVDSQFENKPIERSVHLLTKGDDIQKLSVLQALPQLLQTEPQATFNRIIPKILQELPKSSCEFHVMTSKVFRILIERNLTTGTLLHAVLQGIESRDLIISNTWMETLLSVITYLSAVQIKDEIMPIANSKSLLSQPVVSRVASCRILGGLAVHNSLTPADVKRDILPLVQSLCQDCHPDVRMAICVQLPSVARGLNSEVVNSSLLTSLVELASDDHTYIRSAAVGAIVEIFPYLNAQDKTDTILPLIKQLCEKSLKSIDVTSITIARDLGKLVDGLRGSLNPTDSIWFLHCYRILARRGLSTDVERYRTHDASLDVMCRQHCASNLPAMTYFTTSTMLSQVDVLYGIFQDLAADPCYLVRGSVAGCIHEVAKILGQHNKVIEPDFVRLLRDDSEDVLLKLVPQMGATLELLCVHRAFSRQSSNQTTLEIGRAMLKCQYALGRGYNWRLLTHFIHQLEHLPNCMPSDIIHQHFTPVVLANAVHGRARPVRIQAVRTLLVFLRFNKKELQRKWLRDNFISQLCNSKCSYTRHIYVRLCINAFDIFSEKYFKEHFYESLLDLANDPVANIRLCVADTFANLKRMLILPEDRILDDRLEKIFIKYAMEENDRDVVEVFQTKMRQVRAPKSPSEEEEHEKEQKRKREEEELLASAKNWSPAINGPQKIKTGKTSKTLSTGNDSTLERMPSTTSDFKANNRSTSVSKKRNNYDILPNDMSFLEQHFYIDAGVNLPVPKSEPDNSGRSDVQLLNITDDDKVNLRRVTDKNESKIKRYSSILSADCLEKQRAKKNNTNRRSLNIPIKETSKIPVKARKIKSKPKINYSDDSDKSCSLASVVVGHEKNVKSPSQLPIPKRRSHSEARK